MYYIQRQIKLFENWKEENMILGKILKNEDMIESMKYKIPLEYTIFSLQTKKTKKHIKMRY